MGFTIKKAKRTEVYVKIALMASSGGGKTYSALRLATGMSQEIKEKKGVDAPILMINTEANRGYYYANEFDYDILDLTAPFSPERFIEAINFAISEGYKILIIDSTSHEWEGKGGCLELHQKAGGKYQDWSKVTPRHNKFIETIANSKIHIICTMRGKDQYDMSKDDNGKTTIQKLGVGAKQREGFEYEFTCTFNIDQKTSIAEVQKDNTHIFDQDVATLLTEEHGKRIIQWATSADPTVKDEKIEVTKHKVIDEEIQVADPDLVENNTDENKYPDDLISEISKLFKELKDKELKKEVASKIKEYGKLPDCPIEVQKEIYDKLI